MLVCVVNKPICSLNSDGMCTNGEHCKPCEPECIGCNRAMPALGTHYCKSYTMPHSRWRNGSCALASHLPTDVETTVRINPIKLAKMRRRMGM